VKEEARNFMRREVINSISNSTQRGVDTFTHELDHLRGTVSIVVELIRDRIVGYPHEGWQNDSQIPFTNLQGNNVYPLKSKLLPRDWMVQPNVNVANHEEHVLELFDLLQKQHMAVHGHEFFPHHGTPALSTESSTFVFQGNCDPSLTDQDRDHAAYYPNCTDANNDGTTGGVVRPTSTSAGLEAKAADIGAILKPIWESSGDIMLVSVHFVNQGAGVAIGSTRTSIPTQASHF
jgi:hypothetical protein